MVTIPLLLTAISASAADLEPSDVIPYPQIILLTAVNEKYAGFDPAFF